MSNVGWLFIAFAAVWVILGLYLVSLSARQRNLERRLDSLEREPRA